MAPNGGLGLDAQTTRGASPEFLNAVDAWAADQREPMSRSEAIRSIVTRFLRSKEAR
jgi:hypothetical protein